MSTARTVEEILSSARHELQEREARLDEIVRRAKGELDDVRKTLKKLGGKARNGTAPKPTPSTSGEELREQIRKALEASLNPLTASQIAAEVEADASAQAVAMTLRHMAREGTAQQVDGGWGLPSPIGDDEE